jgi:hypothetical protein
MDHQRHSRDNMRVRIERDGFSNDLRTPGGQLTAPVSRESPLYGRTVFRGFSSSGDGYNVSFVFTRPSLCQNTSAL